MHRRGFFAALAALFHWIKNGREIQPSPCQKPLADFREDGFTLDWSD